MRIVSYCLPISVLVLLAVLGLQAGTCCSLVDPFVGTSGNGHTTPAATVPFGMVQAGPDTGNGDWHHCSGYRFEETTLCGFSQTHLSGTGGADLGDFLVKPFAGDNPLTVAKMDKATERAEPGYYTVTAGGVRTEIAAARCYAVYRFVFPQETVRRILFDNTWTLNADGKAPVELIEKMHFTPDADQRRFTACHRVNGWARGRDIYCAAEFSVPWTKMTLVGDGRYVFEFAEREFELRIALSRTDEERARRNLGAADFMTVRNDARAEWESLLSRVEAKGARDELVNLSYENKSQ
jgi:putative alpha-1,2-mannosidase